MTRGLLFSKEIFTKHILGRSSPRFQYERFFKKLKQKKPLAEQYYKRTSVSWKCFVVQEFLGFTGQRPKTPKHKSNWHIWDTLRRIGGEEQEKKKKLVLLSFKPWSIQPFEIWANLVLMLTVGIGGMQKVTKGFILKVNICNNKK